jgi:hypothetical protein
VVVPASGGDGAVVVVDPGPVPADPPVRLPAGDRVLPEPGEDPPELTATGTSSRGAAAQEAVKALTVTPSLVRVSSGRNVELPGTPFAQYAEQLQMLHNPVPILEADFVGLSEPAIVPSAWEEK